MKKNKLSIHDHIQVLADNSGQPYEKIEKDTDCDYYMTALEAQECGLIDEVVERKSDSDK